MSSKMRLEKIEKRAGTVEDGGSIDLWFLGADGETASRTPNGEPVPLDEVRKEPAAHRIMIRLVRSAEQPEQVGGSRDLH